MDIDAAIRRIAAERASDPLRPVTVIAPSHAAALHLRRRLAVAASFAAVRFEPLARIAELLGAGRLAAAGKSPLARPIGDYVAQQVARDSRGALASIADLTGYGRVLRMQFRRLRRGGITSPDDVEVPPAHEHLREVLRLYGAFRDQTRAFFDDQDLLDAAADTIEGGAVALLQELGDVYVVAPLPQTHAGARFMETLRARTACTLLEAPAGSTESHFVLAPDAASEAREVARLVVDALADGVPLHRLGVLYGADRAYAKLIPEAMRAAGVPCAHLPGSPLIELPAARAVLGLLSLPDQEYARAAVFTALEMATPRTLPAGGGTTVSPRITAWDRLSREAGITRSVDRWQQALTVIERDRADTLAADDPTMPEGRRRALTIELEAAQRLREVVEALADRLEPLREAQPAAQFIEALKPIVRDYVDRGAAGLEDVMTEIDQLGTVASVGGSFTLAQFSAALRANLEIAYTRERGIGEGVLAAEYRSAAGMRFDRTILCGAREGLFPASPGEDAIVPDSAWRELRSAFPFIEDATTRSARASEAAQAAIATARGGRLTWCAPIFEANGSRELYPSPLMVEAAAAHDEAVRTGSDLRRHASTTWLQRASSPLGLRLAGTPLDRAEASLRSVVTARREGHDLQPDHPLHRSVNLLRARSGTGFSEWDGRVGSHPDGSWLAEGAKVSPTRLEAYAECGFRYFGRNVLRLAPVDEPEEREMMEAHVRGTIAHRTLEAFFREQQQAGRPAHGERWSETDRARLLQILDEELDSARQRGLMGMEIFSGHERRSLRADLSEFLVQDELFRLQEGTVPDRLEARIPETPIAGMTLRGVADRIDVTPDRQRAWVIDYKTGSTFSYKDMEKGTGLQGGTKLQLPAYLLAVPDVPDPRAFYWFISQAGGFEKKEYVPSPEKDDRFSATLEAIAAGIRQGVFPAVSGEFNEFFGKFDHCGYCEFDRICSRRREEAFADKGSDPAMESWSAVQRTADDE